MNGDDRYARRGVEDVYILVSQVLREGCVCVLRATEWKMSTFGRTRKGGFCVRGVVELADSNGGVENP